MSQYSFIINQRVRLRLKAPVEKLDNDGFAIACHVLAEQEDYFVSSLEVGDDLEITGVILEGIPGKFKPDQLVAVRESTLRL